MSTDGSFPSRPRQFFEFEPEVRAVTFPLKGRPVDRWRGIALREHGVGNREPRVLNRINHEGARVWPPSPYQRARTRASVATMAASAIEELRARAAGWESSILRRDVEGVQQFLTAGFAVVILQPTRAVVPREQWLKTIADYRIHDYHVEDEIIDVDGDLGVILQRIRLKATVLGQDRSGIFIHTDIWRRTDQWRVWRRHSTPLSAGPYPTAD